MDLERNMDCLVEELTQEDKQEDKELTEEETKEMRKQHLQALKKNPPNVGKISKSFEKVSSGMAGQQLSKAYDR
jgi:hypothetical protein